MYGLLFHQLSTMCNVINKIDWTDRGADRTDSESCKLTFNVKCCLCTIATILSIHYAFILPSVQYVQSLEEHAGNTSIGVPLQTNPTRGLQLFSIFKPN